MTLELAGAEPPGGPGSAGRPDRGAVELMPADPVPSRGQDRVVHGRRLAVTERQFRGHRGVDVEDAAHGPPVQRPGQVEQPSAFGG